MDGWRLDRWRDEGRDECIVKKKECMEGWKEEMLRKIQAGLQAAGFQS